MRILIFLTCIFPRSSEVEFFFEEDGEDGCVDEHRQRGFPTQVVEDVGSVPTPSRGHHEDGRGGEVCQGATDRDIHEQGANDQVLELSACVLMEKTQQHHGRECHCRGFGDQRAKEWHHAHNDEKARHSNIHWQVARKIFNNTAGGCHDGATGCHHHDHEDKKRLRVISVIDVLDSVAEALGVDEIPKQNDRPNAENCLYFAQNMEKALVFGIVMSNLGHACSEKGMENCDCEESRRNVLGGFTHGANASALLNTLGK